MLANIHSILPSESCCHAAACLYTSILVQYWASVSAHCWFNAGQLSTTLAQHYSNTGSAHHASRWPTTAGTPSFNGNPTCLTMAQQQPNIGSLSLAGSAWILCSRTAALLCRTHVGLTYSALEQHRSNERSKSCECRTASIIYYFKFVLSNIVVSCKPELLNHCRCSVMSLSITLFQQ